MLEITELIKRLAISISKDDSNILMNKNKNRLEKNHIIWAKNLHKNMMDFFTKKINPEEYSVVNKIKGMIRKSEAYQACLNIGLKKDENIYFLDMPFYQTGRIKKNELSNKDIKIIENLILKIKPHQIYAAGDLDDPHGTHRLCLRSIFKSIENLKSKPFIRNCYVWLYSGAWNEWKTDEIDMAVPLSPSQIINKRKAIFKHQSQKDGIVFPGQDTREFWQRAEDRNKNTAKLFRKLGMAKYSAMEAFKKYNFLKS